MEFIEMGQEQMFDEHGNEITPLRQKMALVWKWLRWPIALMGGALVLYVLKVVLGFVTYNMAVLWMPLEMRDFFQVYLPSSYDELQTAKVYGWVSTFVVGALCLCLVSIVVSSRLEKRRTAKRECQRRFAVAEQEQKDAILRRVQAARQGGEESAHAERDQKVYRAVLYRYQTKGLPPVSEGCIRVFYIKVRVARDIGVLMPAYGDRRIYFTDFQKGSEPRKQMGAPGYDSVTTDGSVKLAMLEVVYTVDQLPTAWED